MGGENQPLRASADLALERHRFAIQPVFDLFILWYLSNTC
jgi:hypothetical protein